MTDRSLQTFDRSAEFDEIMAELDTAGGVIVRDFIDRGLLDRLRGQLDSHVAASAEGAVDAAAERRRFWGDRTKRFSRLAARAPAFAELLDHELMHRWAERSLAADYWLNTGQAMIVGPGEAAQVLHRDIAIWPYILQMGAAAPEVMVSIVLALTDFTDAVGATRVIPGSHRWADFHRTPGLDEALPAEMPAGSALLYFGKTVHGAGANRTADAWRHGVHMSFVLGWLTPEEASPIGVPWALARQYSPRVQRMLGYASPGPGPHAPPRNWLVDFRDVRRHLGVAPDALA
jgi:ectoine hydroxylase-related dioxygenase (phytanoyl-CoA dioxygenase family)